ncbi:MAG TPA: carbon-nitrogen hydrolase family protein [Bacillota bacterium]
MTDARYPRYRVAAVQASPVFMDRDATITKACRLIEEAGRQGARLVAFPEAFVPGYPYWCRYLPPLDAQRYTLELLRQAVRVPSEATERLAAAARRAGTYVVIGINEQAPRAYGTLFNTNLTISPEGRIVGHHRKLVPTYAEKLVWAYGDGFGLRVLDTELGRLGTLICGENANPLARFVLLADGEQVHVANYPALACNDTGGYDLGKDIEIRSAAHSFEGKVFTIAVSSVIGESVRDFFADQPRLQEILGLGGSGHTAVYGPWGLPVAGPLEPGVERILYADIDLEQALLPKLRHDVAGSYNRFDVLSVYVNRSAHRAVRSGDLVLGPAGYNGAPSGARDEREELAGSGARHLQGEQGASSMS